MAVDKLLKNPCIVFFIRLVRWFPVVFIIAVVCWSYYAYVYELCFNAVTSIAERVIYIICYHCFLFVFLWAYWQTTFTTIGQVPKKFAIPGDLYSQIEHAEPSRKRQLLDGLVRERHLPVMMRTIDGCVRYCDRCKVVKPDRAHHCSLCGYCILKMDHHCPWVNTCVSYTNYKFFIQFLGYALCLCLYTALTDLYYFIQFWTKDNISQPMGKFHVMFLFFVSIMFAISVSVLFFYHLWLACKNRSTLESFRAPIFISGPDKDGFNLGCRGNFQEIFGTRVLLWFVPVFTSLGDGCVYPTRGGRHGFDNSLADPEAGSNYGTPRPDEPSDSHASVTHTATSSVHNSTSAQSPRVSTVQSLTDTHQPVIPLNPTNPKVNGYGSTMTNGVVVSLGDGIVYPVRTFDPECGGLLNDRSAYDHEESEEDDIMSGSDSALPEADSYRLGKVIVR